MSRWIPGPLMLAVALLLAACASQDGFRRVARECQREHGQAEACGGHSIERVLAEVAQGGGPARRLEYLLGFVEFDDHGDLVRDAQLVELFDLLQREGQARDLAIVVYVHGWKHNASPRDRDVANFGELLHRVAVAELANEEPRRVVGIYASWPGKSVLGQNPVTEAANTLLTFWSRKRAAAQVAAGSIRELFGRARAFQERHNRPCGETVEGPCGHDTRLVTIGHSFGGLVAYAAVHQFLVGSAAESDEGQPVQSYGDLVILVNPAFEGVIYESISDIVGRRSAPYPPGQPPVLITLASEADWANRSAFPLGRYTSVVTTLELPRNRAQLGDMVHAVGHIDRLATHRLYVEAAPAALPSPAAPPTLEAEQARQTGRDSEQRRFQEAACEASRLVPGWKRRYGNSAVLEHVAAPPDNPFWVVPTDAALLAGHNALWRDRFLELLYELYTDLVRPDRTLCGVPKAEAPRDRGKPAG